MDLSSEKNISLINKYFNVPVVFCDKIITNKEIEAERVTSFILELSNNHFEELQNDIKRFFNK